MTTIKDRLILGIGRRQPVADPHDLKIDAQTGVHDIVHVLWRLQKDGMVIFQERKPGRSSSIPRNIELTPTGQERYRELTK